MTITIPAPRHAPVNGADAPLTERELEVLRLVAEGLSNREVAQQLWLAESTVKFHLSKLYRRLGVRNRTELSRAAVEQGLVGSARSSPPAGR